MQWLETLVLVEASAGLILASMNCQRLVGYARGAHLAGRRVGASALALLSGAVALEALTFLASPVVEASPESRDASVVAVRSVLLIDSATISALLLRNGRSRG